MKTKILILSMLVSFIASLALAQFPGANLNKADFTGTVIETMNAASYTYVHLDMGKKKIWIAGPKTAVKQGQQIITPGGFMMKDFKSPSLKRSFPEIYFVSKIHLGDKRPAGAQPALPPGHPPLGGAPNAAEKKALGAHHGAAAKPSAVVDFTGLKKADKTVAEIFAESEQLAGKSVKLRGKVVKVTVGVLNRNWLHVRDGTGEAGTNDLTVTSAGEAPLGSTVLVEGTIVTEQDFGLGYKYPVLMEKSTVTVE